MKLSKQVLFILVCLFAVNAYGQQKLSWKKHLKLADELFQQAQYADAGEHYRAAWRQKSKNTDLIHKAGECFYILRDYVNAADAYQHVKNMNDKYPQVQLKYARSLKQSGDFDTATSEFSEYLVNYNGADKSVVAKIVQNEIKGCALARRIANSTNALEVNMEHLSEAVNSPETEFAPLPFNDEILQWPKKQPFTVLKKRVRGGLKPKCPIVFLK